MEPTHTQLTKSLATVWLQITSDSRKHIFAPVSIPKASHCNCQRPLLNVDAFDVTADDLRLKNIDELNQEPVPLFVEKLGFPPPRPDAQSV